MPITSLEEHPVLDLDGADEVDPDLNLIKALGGALLWEKEVIPFGWRTHIAFVELLGGKPELRRNPNGKPFVTDKGIYMLHCRFDGISNSADMDVRLLTRAGVVGTGLSLGIAHQVIIGCPNGVEVRSQA